MFLYVLHIGSLPFSTLHPHVCARDLHLIDGHHLFVLIISTKEEALSRPLVDVIHTNDDLTESLATNAEFNISFTVKKTPSDIVSLSISIEFELR